jgi:acyl-CoA thioesterase-1
MNTKIKISLVLFFVLSSVLVLWTLMQKSTISSHNTLPSTTTALPEFKIVAFGDSLTAGYGVNLGDSYPSQLEKELNSNSTFSEFNHVFKVINMGVSGETTTGGLDRVDFVLSQKPDLILFGLGANDMLRSTQPELVFSNLDAMMQKFSKSGVPVILLGMQSVASNGQRYKKEFDDMYPTLAKTYNVPLVPFFLKDVVLVSALNTTDGIHPNQAGYELIISNNILPTLTPVLSNLLDV